MGLMTRERLKWSFGIGFLDFREGEFDYRITAIGLTIWLDMVALELWLLVLI